MCIGYLHYNGGFGKIKVNFHWERNDEDIDASKTKSMKLVILSHNVRGLNDLDKVIRERYFLNTVTPKADVVLIQEHKMRGRDLDGLGNRLMAGTTSWIPEAAPGERSWINPNAAGKGGVGIILVNKYEKLVSEHGTLYENRVVWIRLVGIEGGNIGIACVYTPSIPTERRHLWHLMMDSHPKDYNWIIGGDLNMTERREDKSNECGRAISEQKDVAGMSSLVHYRCNICLYIRVDLDSHGTMGK